MHISSNSRQDKLLLHEIIKDLSVIVQHSQIIQRRLEIINKKKRLTFEKLSARFFNQELLTTHT